MLKKYPNSHYLNITCITPPSMMMVIEKFLQPCKIFTVQKILQKSTNALDTTRKELGHVFERKKDVKGLGWEGPLTDAKTDTLQNCFGIALRQNAGTLRKWFPHARHLCLMLLAIMGIVWKIIRHDRTGQNLDMER